MTRPEDIQSLHQRILACAAKHGMGPLQFRRMCLQRDVRKAAQKIMSLRAQAQFVGWAEGWFQADTDGWKAQ